MKNSLKPRSNSCLALFTRYPEAGVTKTRLIPALGAEGAAKLQQQMTRRMLQSADQWRKDTGGVVQVYYHGGNEARMREMFGDSFEYLPQCGDTLGARMHYAIQTALDAGLQSVIVVGSDCPEISAGLLKQAFTALYHHDIVLGPTNDGGYYLIGMNHPMPALFPDHMPWGNSQVFAETTRRITDSQKRWACLPRLSDVDEPEDLEVWEKHRHHDAHPPPPLLSIVIPVLNEATHLESTLRSIQQHPQYTSQVEVIVVDGGSNDTSKAIAQKAGVMVLEGHAGRARQMNLGAGLAQGKLLLFLHGDTCLPQGYLEAIQACTTQTDFVAGAFPLQLDQPGIAFRLIGWAANLRSRYFQLPYGDQGIFLKKTVFDSLGGFRELPILEDLDLIQRLRPQGRILLTPSPVCSSSRRWQKRGVWRTTIAHQKILLAWRLGFSPERIQRYRNSK